MNKRLQFFRKTVMLFATAALALSPMQSVAKRLATENFDYNAGGLYKQGDWLRINSNSNDPVQVVDQALTYPGYQDASVGKAVKLKGATDNVATQERLQKQFFTKENAVTEGALYMSALVNVQSLPTDGSVYFLTFKTAHANSAEGFADGKAGNEFGRIFTCPGDADGKFKLGMSKYAANPAVQTDDLDLNTTYLVVIKFEFKEGTTNDECTFWLNPVKGNLEPANGQAHSAGADPTAGVSKMPIQGIELRQGTVAAKAGSDVIIDAIRLADSYADLWDDENQGGGEDPDPEPPTPATGTITAPESLDFGNILQWQSVSKTITIKSEGLEGDITVTAPTGFTPSVTSISAAEAADGYQLTISYKATTAGAVAQNLKLSAEGADEVNVALAAEVTPVTAYARLNFFQNLNEGDQNVYHFQGKATVTYVDQQEQVFYAQDIYGAGGKFSYAYHDACPVKVGDRFSNMYCLVMEKAWDAVTMLVYPVPFDITPDYTVEPLELGLSELNRNPEDYIFRLVKIADVTFANAGGKFSTGSTPITSGGASGNVRVFAGTDIIGTEIPAEATSIVGVLTSATAPVVTMRGLSDLTAKQPPVGAPEISVTPEMLVDGSEYQKINTTTDFAKAKIVYKNMPTATMIYINGTDRAMFSIDAEEIPVGSGEMTVNIKYTPTKVGMHTANLVVYSDQEGVSQSLKLTARAYDPDNMPTLVVNTDALQPFSAEVGAKQEQTFTYTVTGNLDYGKAQIVQPHAGQFQLSSTQLMKVDGTYSIKITFAPQKAGKFTETIELSTDLAEPVSFQITGTATGGDTPGGDAEGDELTADSFSTLNPKSLVVEDFENLGVEPNKPFSLDGWTNAAVEGTRAFWAYGHSDGNKSAKVTAYDYQLSEDEDATMLLLSPALDFKNAAEKLLTFRVMGSYMAKGGTGYFSVNYMEPADDDLKTARSAADVLDNVYIQPIDGLDIPATAENNGQWREYIIDLEGLDLADAFFIGFSYSAPRGKNFPAIYYVDDFSWGRSDIPFIRTDIKSVDFNKNGNISDAVDVAVSGLNLEDDIKVEMTGANASSFVSSHTNLPSTGGTVRINFAPSDKKSHSAYLKLSNAKAPDTYVELLADNTNSGVDNITTEMVEVEGVYNLQGVRVSDTELTPGGYIVKFTNGKSVKKIVK